jgi:hypothetical protein
MAAVPNLGREDFSGFSLQARTMRKRRSPIKINFKNFNMQLFENPSQPPLPTGRQALPKGGIISPLAAFPCHRQAKGGLKGILW